jgi:glyoxalase family protein
VTLSERGTESTARLLSDVMGLRESGSEGGRQRFRAQGTFASIVDVRDTDDLRGGMGTGVVHHVAFATPDDEQQAQWRNLLMQGGAHVSPVMDRKYFHSIYFREPGGVLFEIATLGPGFLVDETPETLGGSLRLPEQYDAMRQHLEQVLPKIRVPEWRMG